MTAALFLFGVLVFTTAISNVFSMETRENYKIQSHVPYFNLSDFEERITISCSRKTVTTTLASGESVTFQSPNYPSDYDSKSLCKWKFKSTAKIIITCLDFRLQSKNKKGKCSDKLTIDETQYCGRSLSSYSGGKQVSVIFKSNKKKHYKGFSCTATAESDTSVTTSPGPCVCGKFDREPIIPPVIVLPIWPTPIYPGTTTEVNEYPWMVALVFRDSNSVYCEGSLINDRWVLTAARCTQVFEVSEVLLGNHLQSETNTAEMRIDVKSVVDHPNYNDQTLDNDFSLLELATPVDLEVVGPEIRPVCLPSKSNPAQYEDVYAFFTGRSAHGTPQNALRDVRVKTMSNDVCKWQTGDSIFNSMICASKSTTDGCQGYSGGPLVYNTGGHFVQIGVVSWGYGCGNRNYPDVFSRVTYAIDWITSTSSSGNTCAPPS